MELNYIANADFWHAASGLYYIGKSMASENWPVFLAVTANSIYMTYRTIRLIEEARETVIKAGLVQCPYIAIED